MGGKQSKNYKVIPDISEIILNLLSLEFGYSISLSARNQNFLVEQYTQNNNKLLEWLDYIKEIRSQSKGFKVHHLENIIQALRQDAPLLNFNAFNTWLSTNSQIIIEQCQALRQESRKQIARQSHLLKSIHHTDKHGFDVNERALYLYKKINLSSGLSPRDKAYSALRELMIEMHDLIQGQGFGEEQTNEELTQLEVLNRLCTSLSINKQKDANIFNMLDIMSHRLIVLGTTVIFGERLIDLSEIYIKSRRIFNISDTHEALNKEMLIVGLCDKTPAFCLELVQMLENSSFDLLNIAHHTLNSGKSQLIQFLTQESTNKAFNNLNLNLLSTLISLSPHVAMSMELKIMQQTTVKNKANELHEKLDSKSKSLIVSKQVNIEIDQLRNALHKNDNAQKLRTYILSLKKQVWPSQSIQSTNITFYQEKIRRYSQTNYFVNQEEQELLDLFENIIIEGIAGESDFSEKQYCSLLFLSQEFEDELGIFPYAALADARNLLQLKDHYETLASSKKLQLMHELLFPLVCQLGEFFMHKIKNYQNKNVTYKQQTTDNYSGRESITELFGYDSSNRDRRSSHLTGCQFFPIESSSLEGEEEATAAHAPSPTC